MKIRENVLAGLWYDKNESLLKNQLKNHLSNSTEKLTPYQNKIHSLKSIIIPHAGYKYCADVTATSFSALNKTKIKKVILLCPSHRKFTTSCLVSQHDFYSTPFGQITVDTEEVEKLTSHPFDKLDLHDDHFEHSLEMACPFIKLCLGEIKMIPIIIGNLSDEDFVKASRILSPLVKREDTILIISSDFCHWGNNYDFYHYEPDWGNFNQSIEKLDRISLDAISKNTGNSFQMFKRSLMTYGNTICGQNPLKIMLKIMDKMSGDKKISYAFPHYKQSNSEIRDKEDSSVSYVSGLVFAE